jgi:hypothetical protein
VEIDIDIRVKIPIIGIKTFVRCLSVTSIALVQNIYSKVNVILVRVLQETA